jgi:ADP-ribosylglycohydrolase
MRWRPSQKRSRARPSFEEALVLVVNLGNDADTVAAVAGALAGAAHGESGIPRRWLEPLCVYDRVVAVADRLADLCVSGAPATRAS